MATRGYDFYGQALRKLQQALWDERMMWHEQTLAAAFVLSVYEVFACLDQVLGTILTLRSAV